MDDSKVPGNPSDDDTRANRAASPVDPPEEERAEEPAEEPAGDG